MLAETSVRTGSRCRSVASWGLCLKVSATASAFRRGGVPLFGNQPEPVPHLKAGTAPFVEDGIVQSRVRTGCWPPRGEKHNAAPGPRPHGRGGGPRRR